MSHRIIRIASDYGLAIAVTPEDAVPSSTGALPEGTRFHRYADWAIGDSPVGEFHEVVEQAAMAYFSGHADGLGWGELPKEPFETLDAAAAHVVGAASAARRERVAAILADPGLDADLRAEFEAILRDPDGP